MEATQPGTLMVSPDTPIKTLNDDELGFGPYVRTLEEIIRNPNPKPQTPLTIGIFGRWGSGKTSLMRLVEGALKQDKGDQKFYTIWFNAWLYSKEESLWRALVTQVLAKVLAIPNLDDPARISLGGLFDQLRLAAGPKELGHLSIATADLLKEGASGAEITLALQHGLDLMEKMSEASGGNTLESAQKMWSQLRLTAAQLEKERIESLERFQTEFRRLVEKHLGERGLLIVFVDDLDRCLPEKAVEVLEAIKLFLDVPNCIFVLGIDRDVVERGIRLRYGEMGRLGNQQAVQFQVDQQVLEKGPGDYRAFLRELYSGEGDIIDGRRYLEKIIQIPFVLPPASPDRLGSYVQNLAPNMPKNCATAILRGTEPNPRQVKRALNIFALLWTLATHLSKMQPALTHSITPVRLVKLIVIQQRHPDLYRLLREDAGRLIVWERTAREASGDLIAELPDAEAPKELKEYDPRLKAALYKLLTMFPLAGDEAEGANFMDMTTDQAGELVFLTYSVEGVPEGPTQKGTQETEAYQRGVEPTAAPLDEAEAIFQLSHWLSIPESEAAYIVSSTMDPIINWVLRDLPVEEMAGQLASLGLELARQWPRYSMTKDGELDRLAAETGLTVQARFTGRKGPLMARMPWEIAYLGDPDPKKMKKAEITDFLGGRHIVERPLVPGRVEVPSESEAETLGLATPDRPLRVYVLPPESWSHDDIQAQFGEILQPDRSELTVGTGVGDFAGSLTDGAADVYIVHARGDLAYGSLDLQWESESLQLADLTGPLQSQMKGQSMAQVPISNLPDRRPCLFFLGFYGKAKREVDWSAWLSTLAAYGAAGVIAPMVLAPRDDWSVNLSFAWLGELVTGSPVGEALLAARMRLFEDKKDPRGLLYVHFGPPTLRLSERDQEESAATA